MAAAAGWRAVYWLAAALMVALAGLLRSELPRYRERTNLRYGALLWSVVAIGRAEPVLRRRALYGALSFGAFSVLWTSLAFVLSSAPYRYGEGTIGLFGLLGAAGAAMASAAGRLADRGRVRALTGATAVGLVASYAALWQGGRSLAALIAGIVLLDVAAQGIHITNQSQIYRLRPEARSRINAFYMTCYFAGGAIGSAGSAALYGAAGWDGVSALGAAFGAGAVVAWLAADRPWRRPAASASPLADSVG